ncbi:hypothetical protein OKA04_09770 [Luteolibacter flavescens]|uniref:Uncharacterized protein n=1 Tax=Luteolibacter flavescens TaxID=1859460 RepID=A0ABT3FNV1_9BACT|nr:hypothetical protein [Luteolibacter flavescens]MCW1885014.1 hypothetical protein [Luteolibacter flavescens]
MLLYKLQFMTPGEATRRSLSARILAGARPDDLLTRLRQGPPPHAVPALKRVRKHH